MRSYTQYAAPLCIVLIWAGWITISRFGVQTELTPADITMLRYWTSFILILPLIWNHTWKKYRTHQYLIVGLGVGFPYTLFSFYGLQEIKAAHAGVLVNGMLPVLGAISAYIFFKHIITLQRWVAIILILTANYIMAGPGLISLSHIDGILLMLGAAGVYTMHLTGVKKWSMTWKDILVTVSTVNVVLFTPLYFFLDSNYSGADVWQIAMQASYQGAIVNIIALMCVAYSVKNLGMMTTSLFMSFVPVATALLAWLVLGESLITRELLGIAGCSAGLFLYARGS